MLRISIINSRAEVVSCGAWQVGVRVKISETLHKPPIEVYGLGFRFRGLKFRGLGV